MMMMVYELQGIKTRKGPNFAVGGGLFGSKKLRLRLGFSRGFLWWCGESAEGGKGRRSCSQIYREGKKRERLKKLDLSPVLGFIKKGVVVATVHFCVTRSSMEWFCTLPLSFCSKTFFTI